MSAVVLAWASAYALMVAVAARRRPVPPRRAVHVVRRVLMLRPYAGVRAGDEQAIHTVPSCPPQLQLTWVGCVADARDTAWPLVRTAAAALRARGLDARALLTGARGPNRKAAQIAGAVDLLREAFDVLVVVDADVDLASVDLVALLRPLGGTDASGRTVGASWSPPHEPVAISWGDRISRAILGGSWHAFALLARLDPRVMVGKAFAVHGNALARIGSLHELSAYLGEDFELARRVEAAGMVVHCTPATVRSMAHHRRLTDVFERYVRWLRVVRAQRPLHLLGYPLLLAAAPLLLAACVLVMPLDPSVGLAAAALVVAARAGVTVLAARTSGTRSSAALFVQGWLADAFLLAALVAASRRNAVIWADRTLVVDADGRLQPSAE